MDWFLYDRNLRHGRIKKEAASKFILWNLLCVMEE